MESLYRKYRPQVFSDMVGQQHIVSTLHNALAEGRVAHAYLFSGPRGTGKTSTARMLAKALLCEGGPTPEPDGTCEQCQAIAAGQHPDVYELDAASRTGVDNVREEIINRVAFAPTRGRYKVYIIDEVHMLTVQAFNALLKTLEEPPEHVIFILCTTDPQKVPETILSRCQRLEFHRIATADIEGRLAYVCEQEGFEADPQALALVARHARGGMRDALSMLEQLSVFGGGAVRLEDAQAVLGEVSGESLSHMVEMIAARDVAGCFAQAAELADRGADITQYVRDLVGCVRDAYVVSVAGQGEDVLAAGGDCAASAELARKVGGSDRLARILDVLGELESELRYSVDARLSLEVALARLARPQADLTVEALAERVDALEAQVRALVAGGAVPAGIPADAPARPAAPAFGGAPAQVAPAAGACAGPRPMSTSAPRPVAAPAYAAPAPRASTVPARPAASAPAPAPRAAAPAAATGPVPASILDAATSQRLWGELFSRARAARASLGGILNQTQGILSAEDVLTIVSHGSPVVIKMLDRPEHRQLLEKLASEVYCRPVRVELLAPGAAPAASAARPATAAAPAPASAPRPAAPAARPVPAAASRPAAAPAPAAASAPASAPRPAPASTSRPQAAAASAAPWSAPAPAAAAPAPRPAGTSAAPRPAPASAPRPAAASAPVAPAPRPQAQAAPAVEEPPFTDDVPDDVYDAYDETPADEPPADDEPGMAGEGPSGAAPMDEAATELAQLLSSGFGGYVKVKDE